MRRTSLTVLIAMTLVTAANADDSLDALEPVDAANEAAIDAERQRIQNEGLPEPINILDFITMSNTTECIKLTLEGLGIFARPSASGVEIIVVPEFSHYNPDFVVAIYPRIGGSPIVESEALYGELSTQFSRAMLTFLDGEDPGDLYDDQTQFGGHMSESGDGNSISMFSEVEVIGHPGNFFSLAAMVMADRTGDLAGDIVSGVASVLDVPNQTQKGLDAATDTLNEGGAGLVPSTTGNMQTEVSEGELGDLSVWTDQYIIPQLLGEDMMNALAYYGTMMDFAGGDYGAILGQYSEYYTRGDSVIDVGIAVGEHSDEEWVNDLAAMTSTFEGLMAALEGEEYAAYTEALQGAMDSGASYGGSDVSLCPSDTTLLTPYYLSGFNVLSWRFGLPELAFPRSYAIPLIGSELFVGVLDETGAPATAGNRWSLPDFSTWGNIYPRQGWVAQPDPVKNRAVAGFRGVHVVTREDQTHIYNFPEYKKDGFQSRNDIAPLSPNDIETGAWQMMYPVEADACTLLHESDIETPAFNVGRDEDLTSHDGSYVFNVWRRYQCLKQPSGAVYLFTIPLGGIELM